MPRRAVGMCIKLGRFVVGFRKLSSLFSLSVPPISRERETERERERERERAELREVKIYRQVRHKLHQRRAATSHKLTFN